MKIVALQANNFKRLKAVEITVVCGQASVSYPPNPKTQEAK